MDDICIGELDDFWENHARSVDPLIREIRNVPHPFSTLRFSGSRSGSRYSCGSAHINLEPTLLLRTDGHQKHSARDSVR
jgi:hypothetical protein